MKILIRRKRAGPGTLSHTHTLSHTARINRVQAKELHCRILIAETTSHEEGACVCKKKRGGYDH